MGVVGQRVYVQIERDPVRSENRYRVTARRETERHSALAQEETMESSTASIKAAEKTNAAVQEMHAAVERERWSKSPLVCTLGVATATPMSDETNPPGLMADMKLTARSGQAERLAEEGTRAEP